MSNPWGSMSLGPRSRSKPAACPTPSKASQNSASKRNLVGTRREQEGTPVPSLEDNARCSMDMKLDQIRLDHCRATPRSSLSLERPDSGAADNNSQGRFETISNGLQPERERKPPVGRKLPGSSPRRSWSATSKGGRTVARDPFAADIGVTVSGRVKKSSASRHSLTLLSRTSPKGPFSLRRQSTDSMSRSPEELTSMPAQPLYTDPFAAAQDLIADDLRLQTSAGAMAPVWSERRAGEHAGGPSAQFPDLESPGCTRRQCQLEEAGSNRTAADDVTASADLYQPSGVAAVTLHLPELKRGAGFKKLQSFGAKLKLFGGNSNTTHCTFREVAPREVSGVAANSSFNPNSSSIASRSDSNTSSTTNCSISTVNTLGTFAPASVSSSANPSLASSRTGSYMEISHALLPSNQTLPTATPTSFEDDTLSPLRSKLQSSFRDLEESPVGSASAFSPSTFADSSSINKWTPRGTPTVADGGGTRTVPSPLGAPSSPMGAGCAAGPACTRRLQTNQPLLFLERRMGRVVGGNSAALDALGFSSQAEAVERFGVFWSLFDICASLKMEEWDEAASKVAQRKTEFITLKLRLRDLNSSAPFSDAWVYLELHPGGSTPGTLSGTHLAGYLSLAPCVPTASAAPAVLSSPPRLALKDLPPTTPGPETPTPSTTSSAHAHPHTPSAWRRLKGGIGALMPWHKRNLPGKRAHHVEGVKEEENEIPPAVARDDSSVHSKPQQTRSRRRSLDMPRPQGPMSSRSSIDLQPSSASEASPDEGLGKSTGEGSRGSFLWFLPGARRSMDLASSSGGEGRSNGRHGSARRRSIDGSFSAMFERSRSGRSESSGGRLSLDIPRPSELHADSAASAEENSGPEGPPKDAAGFAAAEEAAVSPHCTMPAIAEGSEVSTAASSSSSARTAPVLSPALLKGAAATTKAQHSREGPSQPSLAEASTFRDLPKPISLQAQGGGQSHSNGEEGRLMQESDISWLEGSQHKAQVQRPAFGLQRFVDLALQSAVPPSASNRRQWEVIDIIEDSGDDNTQVWEEGSLLDGRWTPTKAASIKKGAAHKYSDQRRVSNSAWMESESEGDSPLHSQRRRSLDLPMERREMPERPGSAWGWVNSTQRVEWDNQSSLATEGDRLVMRSATHNQLVRGEASGPHLPQSRLVVGQRMPAGSVPSATRRTSFDTHQSRSWSKPNAATGRKGGMLPAVNQANLRAAEPWAPRSLDQPAGDTWQEARCKALPNGTSGDIWGGQASLQQSNHHTGRRSLDLRRPSEGSFQGAAVASRGPGGRHRWANDCADEGSMHDTAAGDTAQLSSRLSSLRRVASQQHLTSPSGAPHHWVTSAPPMAHSLCGAHRQEGCLRGPQQFSLPSSSSVGGIPLPNPLPTWSPGSGTGGRICAAVGRASDEPPPVPAHPPPLVRRATGPTNGRRIPPTATAQHLPISRSEEGRQHAGLLASVGIPYNSHCAVPETMRRVLSAGEEHHDSGDLWRRGKEAYLATLQWEPACAGELPACFPEQPWCRGQPAGSEKKPRNLPHAGLAPSSLPRPPLAQQGGYKQVLPGGSGSQAKASSPGTIPKEALLRLLSLSSTESGEMVLQLAALDLEAGKGPGCAKGPGEEEGNILVISTPGRDSEAEGEDASRKGGRAVPGGGLVRTKSTEGSLERKGSEGEEWGREGERVKKKVTWAERVAV